MPQMAAFCYSLCEKWRLARPVLNERGETLADVIRARRERLIEEFGGTFED